jgi:uncharacterized protein (DUF427 family)
MNPAPGFKKYPGHRVSTNASSAHVKVMLGGEVIADTREAVELHESFGEGKKTVAPVVYYIPRKDVKMERLARTAHSTHCPFKGDASYFSVVNGPQNAVWSYESPYDEMLAISERLAFYPDRFEIKSSAA